MFGKKMSRITQKDLAATVLTGVGVSVLAALLTIPIQVAAFVGILFAGIVLMFLVLYGKVNESMDAARWHYREVEELFSLFRRVEFRAPLPTLRGWALSPDVANILVETVLREKPRRVLDLGSGASTLLIGYALEKNGVGTVHAIDHESNYAERSRKLIHTHGLDTIASVTVAPLSDVEIPAGKWRWYDTTFLHDLGKVDLVFVDGPPDRSHFLARYPALPLLIEHLSPNAIIVVDDAYSPGEKEMIQRWLSEFPDFVAEHVSTEKGTCVLRRI